MNLKHSILKTITWFDLFDFPLTAEEIMGYLYDYRKQVHIKEIKGVLKELSGAIYTEPSYDKSDSIEDIIAKSDHPIEEIKGYFVLKGHGNIIEKRKTRKFIAEKFWSRAKLYCGYLRNIPFVKMIAVCNNLSYNNSAEQSDIDLFIVIQSGRMWTGRLFITLILHFFGVRRHGDKTAGRFCLSFFVTENKLNMEELQIKPQDPYLAYWTKLLAPLYGEDMYDKFQSENEKWIYEKYGLKFSNESKKHLYHEKKSVLKILFQWLLNGYIGNAIEQFLKCTFKKRTLRKMKHLGSEANVIVSDDILKFHNNDRRRGYYEKLKIKN